MAHTNNGCVNKLGDNQLPADYTKPVVTVIADFEYARTKVLSILKATVHNADPAVTMANIIANGAIGINKQVTDLVAADFLAGATVSIYSELVALQNNFQSMLNDSPALTDAAPAYLATIYYYVKAV